MSVRVYAHHDDPRGVERDTLIEALAEPPADPESAICSEPGIGEGLLAYADEGECKWVLTVAGRVRVDAEANYNWAKARPGTARALLRYRSAKVQAS